VEWWWRLRWRCVRFEYESTLEVELLRYISNTNMNKEVKDIQVWGERGFRVVLAEISV